MSMNDPNRPPTGEVHGSSTVTPLGKKSGGLGWLWWLLGALVLLALLFFLLRGCGEEDRAATTTTTTAPAVTAPATTTVTDPATTAPPAGDAAVTDDATVGAVTLPNGQTLQAARNSLTYQLPTYLASNEPAGRRFTFENTLTFPLESAELDPGAQPVIQRIGQIMQAYPNSRYQVVAFADPTGPQALNTRLAEQRAESVVRALVAQGVSADRLTATGGGETNPANPATVAENLQQARRADLIVTAK